MDITQESGVRVVETGYLCPDMVRFNFLPFAPDESLDDLINVTGGQGEMARLDNRVQVNQLSGVLGNGTLYPGSGTLEELSRLFWCVKAWTLTVTLNVQVPAQENTWSDPLSNFLAGDNVPTTFNFCGIENGIASVTLQLQDIFASGTSANQNLPLNNFQNLEALSSNAIPLDPIIKWEDLMCRDRYFSWAPPLRLQTGFYTAKDIRTEANSPYIMTFPMQSIDTDIFNPTITPNTYGMWNLAIMNTDLITRGKGLLMPTGQFAVYVPTGTDLVDEQAYSLAPHVMSGALTTESGQITGYGFREMISGDYPVLAYRRSVDSRDPITSGWNPKVFNPDSGHNYFPLLHFMMRMRSFPTDSTNSQCGFSADVTTLQPASGWTTAGQFTITDTNITGYPTTSLGRSQKQIFSCPLYAPGATAQLLVNVTLSPLTYWLTSSGVVNY